MENVPDLSIVISSFNRDGKVGETLEHLYASDVAGLNAIEVIVIDDGSPAPVRNVLAKIGDAPKPFEVRLIEQKNSGIGATRNRGYREAKCHLIMFLDDDILLKPSTIRDLMDSQRSQPGAVIFGNYPFRSHSSESLRKFAVQLYGYDTLTEEPKFAQVNAITSGLLMVDRAKLPDHENFYRDDLSIPAAEEHDVIARFYKSGIPIYNALHISAVHNHQLELNWLAKQQYKYGLATAEAFEKVPELVEMPRYAELRGKLSFAGAKGLAKRAFASKVGRSLILRLAQFAEALAPNSDNNRLFGLTASAWFWGGVADGRKRFAGN